MKSIGGFYYVRADGEDYECKARGSFRKSGNSPVAGDRVNISVPNDGFCAIEEILPRKNKLRRPALANLDILLLVCSTVEPLPNFTIIDKNRLPAAVNNNIGTRNCRYKKMIWKTEIRLPISTDTQVLRFFSVRKMILHKPKNSKAICPARFQPLSVTAASASPHYSISFFHRFLLKQGRQVKNSAEEDIQQELLNCLNLTVVLWQTHPDFQPSIFSVNEMIDKSRLQYCFPEFRKIFRGVYVYFMFAYCEKGCRILEALSDGEIEETRHRSYVQMYNEVKDIKSWQIKE